MSARYRIRAVEPKNGFVLRLTFADGRSGEIDMAPLLWGQIFEPVRSDVTVFRAVRVDVDAGTIVWPNGTDYAPDALYDDMDAAGLLEAPGPSKRRAL